jgi:hypothetical protein
MLLYHMLKYDTSKNLCTPGTYESIWKIQFISTLDILNDCNPCFNGGTVDYNCTCAPGYTGSNCEIGRRFLCLKMQ